ncbi:amino acid adenylation domain-containing protein [Nocardia alni]|uniref:amino acid adenylation domain-containing protein n=1 Tax=Nocardia alni TaxID=2815723 RepID=UPI0020B3290C|nr:non-ribosomal peptide synthetase [Nocardia alni]
MPDGAFELSAAQRGIWFAQQLAGEMPISIAQYIELVGKIDLDLLAAAARQAGREFGTGYVRIAEFDGRPLQVVDTSLYDGYVLLDLRDDPDPESAAYAWMRAEYSRPLDLLGDRLVSSALLRLSDERWFWYSRFHHIVIDGMGALAMVQRTAQLYNAALRGDQAPPATADALRRIVEDDVAYRNSDRFRADGEYWREHLAGMADPIGLAGRTAPANAHPILAAGELPPDTTELIAAVATAQSSSLAPIVVGAFAAYLGSMTGAAEVVLSLPVSARSTAWLRRSGGMIANVVPLRLRLRPGATVREVIGSAQTELTGALRRQRYRQEDIVRDLGWPMDEAASFGPSVNLMMAGRLEFGPVTGRLHVLTSGPIDDLFVNLYPEVGGERTRIDFQANSALYGSDQLTAQRTRFLDYLHRFVAADGAAKLVTLDALSAAERSVVVPARGRAAEPTRTFAEILGEGVAIAPDSIALVDETVELTYRQLDEYSNRLARVLIAEGVGPEQAVAIAIPRSIESVQSVWAVAKTGAAFVPIDPEYPADRIEHMVTDSRVASGLCVAAAHDRLPDTVCWSAIDDPALRERIAAESGDPIRDDERLGRCTIDQTAYIIYTSGSTGLPKGVMVPHRGLTSLTASCRAALDVSANSVVAHVIPPSFDVSIEELLVTFGTGATLAVVPPSAYGGEELTRRLREHHVTHLDSTPAVVSTLDPRRIPDLRAVEVGGDVCPPELAVAWSGRRLVNAYGPTETTITSTFSGPLRPDRAITIGSLVRGTTATVLDPWLRPVPLGTIGELYIGGAGVARGYYNRRGMTASRFVADPHEPGARRYRTGDLVRWSRNDDGELTLQYVGRADFQVKLRGYRIELGEIDEALRRGGEIDEAVTIGTRTAAGGSVLVSYVVGKPGADVRPERLRAALVATLPSYMVPAAITVVEDIPRMPSGKVDRKALPTTDFVPRDGAGRAPTTPREATLATLFAQALGVDSVGVDDSFFALGGDSIVAVQFLSQARAAGLKISAQDMFEHKTVAALAAVAVDIDDQALAELPGGGVGPIDPTPALMSMTARIAPDGYWKRNGQAILTELPAGIGREQFAAAIRAVIDHHDMLRMRLHPQDSGWMMTVRPRGAVDADALITVVPASPHLGEACERELRRATELLDPTEGTVARFVIIEPADGPSLLWLVLHRSIVDAASWRILLSDLAAACTSVAGTSAASVAGQRAPAVLPPVGTSFRRWARGLGRQAADQVGELPVWQGILGSIDPRVGASDLDPAVDIRATSARLRTAIPPDLTDTLLTVIPERFHCRPEDALLTALAMALSAWRLRIGDGRVGTGDDRTATMLSVEGDGRERAVPGADLARTVGRFRFDYPVVLDLAGVDLDDAFAGGAAAGAALMAVKEQLRAVPADGIGFDMLRRLGPRTADLFDSARAPRIGFRYLGRPATDGPDRTERETLWLPRLFAITDDDRTPLSKVVDIAALVRHTIDGPRLALTWTYATLAIGKTDIDEITELWHRAAAALAGHALSPGAGGHTPSDFPLTPVPQEQIDGWQLDYPNLVDVWPLSPLQAGMFFHARYDIDATDDYLVQSRFTLTGPVDADRLRAAAQALVDRHESLRTGFVETGQGPRQVVLAGVPVEFRVLDPADRAEADRVIELDSTTRFDLAHPPLLRFIFARTDIDTCTLVMTNHHIVLDGWSGPLLVRELLALYQSSGDPSVLPAAGSYREFLSWLGEQDAETSKAAWQQALSGLESPTRVTSALPASPRAADEIVSVELPAETVTALEHTARAAGATVNTVVQAGWAMLLALLTGRTDVMFGTAVSVRPPQLPGAQDLVGLLINTVPVRVRLDPRESVADLLSRIHSEQAAVADHRHIGLREIQRWAGQTELFDTMVAFESYPMDSGALTEALDLTGIRLVDTATVDSSPYPLALIVIPTRATAGTAGGLRVTLKLGADLSAQPALRHLLDRFVRVITRIAGDPSAPVPAVPRCDDAELAAVLPRRGPRAVPPRLLPDILGAGAAVDPDAIAIGRGDSARTYRELDASANQLARVLLRRGAGPDVFVALALRRSPEWVRAVWAVAKTGAAFVPLDPNYPAERIAHMLTDSAAHIGISLTGESLPDTVDWLRLDDPGTECEMRGCSAEPITDADRPTPLRMAHAAYLIYTSGSTGTPKGVVITQRGLADLTTAQQESLDVDATASVLQVASPSFDASVFEILLAHAQGARLVIAPPEVSAGEALTDLIRTEQVTHCVTTPSVLGTMEPTDGLRLLALAGEAAGPELVRRWSTHVPLANLYGPTEFTVWATAAHLCADHPITIGGPIRGASIAVLDAWLRPVPAGVPGELYLAGPGLARGYHDRPALTASRFVACPYGDPGELMYRTGDVVRWIAPDDRGDYALDYLGRNDAQVKIRGQRVELDEIDAVLGRDDQVKFVVTLDRVGPTGGTVLVSHVLPEAGIELDIDRLRARAIAALPPHMVPGNIVVLDRIPLTPVGKLDRNALPRPDFSTSRNGYSAPRTAEERAVATIFADVLGRRRVGVDESYFELGGDSLLATQVIARVNLELGSAITMRDLFDAPTVATLCTRVIPAAGARGLPLPGTRIRPDRIPLSPAQQRMWAVNQLDPGSAAYNIAVALRLCGDLDVAALRRAVADVIARHESLRTVYPADAQGPHQVVLDAQTVTPGLDVIDVDEGPGLRERIDELAWSGFDLTRELPLRIGLYRIRGTSPAEHVAVLAVHHISADGASTTPLAADIIAAYLDGPAGLARRPRVVQYPDYALWQRELLGDERDPESLSARQIQYWTQRLTALADVMPLPLDRPRPALPSLRSLDLDFRIDGELHTALTRFARAENVSMFMLAHAALAIVFSRLGAGEDVVIGTPMAGRGAESVQNMIGMFVNTLALRTPVDSNTALREFLSGVRDVDLDAFTNADVPFERIVQIVNPARSAARHPIFQVLLVMQNFVEPVLEVPGLRVRVEDINRQVTPFDLTLELRERFSSTGEADGIDVRLTYATDLFDPDTAVSLAARYQRVLTAFVTDAAVTVGDAEILDDAERAAAILIGPPSGGESLMLPTILATTAATWPERPAVVFDGAVMSYRQLDAASNRLARNLIGRGVGAETIVVLALPRSTSLMVALWAVAKTGAAFLPLDPAQPVERIHRLLRDSGAAIGLTVGAYEAKLPDVVRWLALDDVEFASAGEESKDTPIGRELVRPIRPDNPAWVIYTSGSTGTPKGVCVTHRGIADLVAALRESLELDETARVLQAASPAFDAWLFEALSAFASGGALVVASPRVVGGGGLDELIATQRVTHVSLTPTVLATLDPAAADSVRTLVFGGESLSTELVERWATGRTVRNVYGPTEFSIWATTSGPLRAGTPITIGGPIRGAGALALDARLGPVPAGVLGELYLAGPALARGYHDRPGVTAARFVANPYGAPGDRMYRTGDLVRRTAMRELLYVGRTDFQVKIHGVRIELGEIDAALRQIDGVAFALTLGVDGPTGATTLVSYVVGELDAELDATSLTAAAARVLPAYMVPAKFMVLEEVPRNAVGKFDRAALPKPVFETDAAAYRAPTTPTEERLTTIVAEVLGLERVGVDDAFFAIGGDSITAIAVVSRAAAQGVTIHPQQIFEHRTIAELAAATEAADTQAPTGLPLEVLLPIRTGGDRPPVFCIHPASGTSWCYWGLAQALRPGRPIYGLQAPELGGLEPPPQSIDAYAERYAREIRTVQPEGPYHLLGWSLGGTIAHATAARLRADGAEIGTLALLDSAGDTGAETTETYTAGEIVHGLGAVFGIEDVPADATAQEAADLICAQIGAQVVDAATIERITTSYNSSVQAAARYQRPIFDGDMLYFSATVDTSDIVGPEGWRANVSGTITTHEIEATHQELTAPHVLPTIARALDQHLGQADPQ